MHALENKIPPPIVAVLCGALMWGAARYVPGIVARNSWHLIVAAAIVVVGVLFAIAGVISFRRAKTTVNPLAPEKASSLVASGIYRYTRNPMYVGIALVLLAWAVFLLSPVALLGVVAFILYLNRFQIAPEERALESLFGAQFVSYKSRVRRWL